MMVKTLPACVRASKGDETMPGTNRFYLCNGSACDWGEEGKCRQECYVNGGSCRHTTDWNYARNAGRRKAWREAQIDGRRCLIEVDVPPALVALAADAEC